MRVLERDSIAYIKQFQDAYFVNRDVNSVLMMLDDRVNWISVGKTRVRGKKKIECLLRQECEAYLAHFVINAASYQADLVSDTICVVQGELSLRETDALPAWPDVILFLSAVVRENGHGLCISQVHMSAQLQEEREALIPRIQTFASIEPLRRMLSQKNTELEEKTAHLDALTNNIPGGVIQCLATSEMELLHYSQGFLKLIGYTAQEVKKQFSNSLKAFIHPDDVQPTLAEIARQLEQGSVRQVEYRCICKNGDVIWILDKGQLDLFKDGARVFNCILTDVTQAHTAQEALRLSLERHQIIMEQTENIIFEWDVTHDIVSCSTHWEDKFGLPSTCTGREFRSLEHIHPEDTFLFQALIRKIDMGIPYCEAEFRSEGKDGHYNWFRVRVSLQRDHDNRPLKAVGVIIDIDREKRESQRLQDRAERDSLTGLYNKGAVKALIEQYLDYHNCNCALLVVDIDNFKQVNDQLGHLSGDVLLSNISQIFQKLFRSLDIIGRIGGDEFIVLLRDLSSKDVIAQKSRQLLQEVNLLQERLPCSISCSIGIAMCPSDGTEYTTLFHNADLALYSAKSKGKNTYSFFSATENFSADAGTHTSAIAIDSEHHCASTNSRLIEYLFHTLYESRDMDAVIPQILEIIGKQFHVSRILIFEETENRKQLEISYEWCDEGISSRKKITETPDLSVCKNYYQRFDERGFFLCQDTNAYSDAVRDWAKSHHIFSSLQCIIWESQHPCGFIAFDNCRAHCAWSEEHIQSLSFIAEVMGVFLSKHRSLQAIAHTLGCMELILDRQDSLIYVVSQKGHRLLYANQAARAVVPDFSVGDYCYSAFFQRTQPCSNCPVTQIKSWEQDAPCQVLLPFGGRTYSATIRKIHWPGTGSAYLVTCTDLEQ